MSEIVFPAQDVRAWQDEGVDGKMAEALRAALGFGLGGGQRIDIKPNEHGDWIVEVPE